MIKEPPSLPGDEYRRRSQRLSPLVAFLMALFIASILGGGVFYVFKNMQEIKERVREVEERGRQTDEGEKGARPPVIDPLADGNAPETKIDYNDRNKEPNKSFHEARQLLKEGKYMQAHEKHLWLFNNIDQFNPDSFFLSLYNLTYDWHQVGLKYSPAMEALIARRDKRAAWLLAEGKDVMSTLKPVVEDGVTRIVEGEDYMKQKTCFREISSINEWLGEDDKTVALYKKMQQRLPRFADSVYVWVEDALFSEKEYTVAVPYQMDPDDHISVHLQGYNITSKAQGGRLKNLAQRRFEEAVCRYMTIQAKSGSPENARKAQKLALKSVDSEVIRNFKLPDKE